MPPLLARSWGAPRSPCALVPQAGSGPGAGRMTEGVLSLRLPRALRRATETPTVILGTQVPWCPARASHGCVGASCPTLHFCPFSPQRRLRYHEHVDDFALQTEAEMPRAREDPGTVPGWSRHLDLPTQPSGRTENSTADIQPPRDPSLLDNPARISTPGLDVTAERPLPATELVRSSTLQSTADPQRFSRTPATRGYKSPCSWETTPPGHNWAIPQW
ncbi:uncharacterized protein LOC134473471 [Cavia porcellus]|uniref:uncharacterized protein LOC134473471 n=1 Tax=Cavia porcellus TaxID=10141 RepID=UPI002FE098A4